MNYNFIKDVSCPRRQANHQSPDTRFQISDVRMLGVCEETN